MNAKLAKEIIFNMKKREYDAYVSNLDYHLQGSYHSLRHSLYAQISLMIKKHTSGKEILQLVKDFERKSWIEYYEKRKYSFEDIELYIRHKAYGELLEALEKASYER